MNRPATINTRISPHPTLSNTCPDYVSTTGRVSVGGQHDAQRQRPALADDVDRHGVPRVVLAYRHHELIGAGDRPVTDLDDDVALQDPGGGRRAALRTFWTCAPSVVPSLPERG